MSDKIAAIATGHARTGIGILRLSGDGCIEAAEQVFRLNSGRPLTSLPDRKLALGTLFDAQGRAIDHCMAFISRAPHSYTGEDTAEIQCHGSPAALTAGLEALFAAGFRQARPGEFTRRAFLNGQMDLTQAEAVMEVIAANGRQGAALAKSALAFTGGWYKLIIAAAVIVIACAAMVGFLGTRLGLSIRATGDNAAMVRASSINPAFTITVGLCISGALTALSGGLLAQYQKSSDINVGTGMVTIALASLIIGETLVGKRTMVRRVLGVVFGSCLYRFIVAVALRFNVPAAAMKLVSALIVAVAISMPAIRAKFAFEQRKHNARKEVH